jgi:hypothetical protein
VIRTCPSCKEWRQKDQFNTCVTCGHQYCGLVKCVPKCNCDSLEVMKRRKPEERLVVLPAKVALSKAVAILLSAACGSAGLPWNVLVESLF